MFYGDTERNTSSSMVHYLYPEGERPVVDPEITPRLELPLRVGIAFVPTTDRVWQGSLQPAEARRIELLEKVKAAFEGVDYVEDIQIIPSSYLGSAGGFQALEQTSRLYDLDVFALVSWDQVVNTNDTVFSVLFWTISGGYVIPASENNVHTMLDTAVFDIRTRKLLLRAPGFDHASRLPPSLRKNSQKRVSDMSFERAVGEMSKNLEAEIEKFGNRVKEDESVQIAYAKGYKGSWVPVPLIAALALALAVLWVPQRSAVRLQSADAHGATSRRQRLSKRRRTTINVVPSSFSPLRHRNGNRCRIVRNCIRRAVRLGLRRTRGSGRRILAPCHQPFDPSRLPARRDQRRGGRCRGSRPPGVPSVGHRIRLYRRHRSGHQCREPSLLRRIAPRRVLRHPLRSRRHGGDPAHSAFALARRHRRNRPDRRNRHRARRLG